MDKIKETKIKLELCYFVKEIEEKIKDYATLTEIRNWSYEKRESDGTTPYLAGPFNDEGGNPYIQAEPTKKQKDLYEFFNLKAHNSKAVSRYYIHVYQSKVVFKEVFKIDGKFHKFDLIYN